MSKGKQYFNETLKEFKKVQKDLAKFNESKLADKGYPRWIIVQHKQYLEETLLELDNKLKAIKASKNTDQKSVKPHKNPYQS